MSDHGLTALHTAIGAQSPLPVIERKHTSGINGRKAAMAKPRSCETCGATFTASSPGQRWCCYDCRPSAYQGATVACKQCGTAFRRTTKLRVFCSDDCRTAHRPERAQYVAVSPSRWTTYGSETFTDEGFREALTKEADRLLSTAPMPVVTRGAVRLDHPADQSGVCPVCGGAYTFPLRRPGVAVCSLSCYEDYQRRKEIERG